MRRGWSAGWRWPTSGCARRVPAYWMLGNDDPPRWPQVLDAARGASTPRAACSTSSGYGLVSWGYSEPDAVGQLPRDDRGGADARVRRAVRGGGRSDRVVFNCHVPPYDSGLDTAPVLDEDLVVQQSGGQVKLAPVGSVAVRAAIERWQPLVSLHGHSMSRRLPPHRPHARGQSRSDYGTGELNGALLTLAGDKLKAHQLVRG